MSQETNPSPYAPSDVQAAIDVTLAAHTPHQLEPGHEYALVVPAGGHVERIDLDLDMYRARPRRKEGTTVVEDVASFVHLWNKHADVGSEIYAHLDSGSITAVLDAHKKDAPRFGEHQVKLQLRYSQAWGEWTNRDRKGFGQTAFAEWIEDHLADIRDPSSAELLEVVQTLEAATKVSFTSGVRLQDGQRRLRYEEATEAKAGQKGELTIPGRFTLGLEVYERTGVADEVTARLRYRINGGDLSFSYHLDEVDAVRRAAFAGVVARLADEFVAPILYGHGQY